jgi:hypothetical protein
MFHSTVSKFLFTVLSEQLNITAILRSGHIKLEDLMRLIGGVLYWRYTITYISVYFIGPAMKVGCCTQTDNVASANVMLQMMQLPLQQCPVQGEEHRHYFAGRTINCYL